MGFFFNSSHAPLGGDRQLPLSGRKTWWKQLLNSSLTSEALATLAGEAVQLVDACASILARARQTIVPVQVTVLPHPSGLAVTAVPGTGQRSLSDDAFLLPPA